MITSAQFWDKVAEKYAKQPIGNMEKYEQGLAVIKRYLTPQKSVIELGAGTSSTAIILAPHCANYTSTDVSSKMVQIGREKAKAIANLNVQVFDPTRENWQGEKADVVLGLNFLHLVEDVPRVLGQASLMLEEGGVFISKSACISGKYSVLIPIIALMRLIGKAPKLTSFSSKKLEAMIKDAGFEIIPTPDAPSAGMVHFIVARKVNR